MKEIALLPIFPNFSYRITFCYTKMPGFTAGHFCRVEKTVIRS